MYLQHWGLRKPPFRHEFDGGWHFEGPTQEEALARLFYLVDYGHRLGLICAPTGVGKTWLLSIFRRQLAAQGRPVVMVNLQGVDLTELYWKLAEALGLAPTVKDSTLTLWRKLQDRLHQFRLVNERPVLLLDDADECEPEAMSGLVRLLNSVPMQGSGDGSACLVMTCRPDGLRNLGGRVTEQTHLMMGLEPLTVLEARSFVQTCLLRAGRANPIFSNAALLRIHELSDGALRRTAHLADLALAAAAAQGLAYVDTETIDGVYQELGARQLSKLSA